MALYRNIGNVGGRVGLSLLEQKITLWDPAGDTDSGFFQPVDDMPSSGGLVELSDFTARANEATANYQAEMNARYDWLISHNIVDIKAAGYYVTADNGSIFQWTDPAHTASTVYIPIQEIQRIENARGTAGALLLHMQEPVLAKDTAGYEGGGSATWYKEGGVDPGSQMVTTPIPQVQTLSPTTTATTDTPTTPVATQPKNNLLPVAVVAGLTIVAIAGESLLNKRKKIVFVSGLGLLFYLAAKKQ